MKIIRQIFLIATLIVLISTTAGFLAAFLFSAAKPSQTAKAAAPARLVTREQETWAPESVFIKRRLASYYHAPKLILGGNINGSRLTLRLQLTTWNRLPTARRSTFLTDATSAWQDAYVAQHGNISVGQINVTLVLEQI